MKGRISMVPLELGLVAMGMEGATGREKKQIQADRRSVSSFHFQNICCVEQVD